MPSTKPLPVVVNFDGSAGPTNPGKYACYAFVVKDPNMENEFAENGPTPNCFPKTNNVAEYYAIVSALRYCLANYKEREIIVIGDSALCIKQINGEFRCKKPHLQELLNMVKDLKAKLNVSFKWVPRDLNKVADGLSKYQNVM